MPKISVIIPVYNTEKYLRKCLDSVCNQTLSDIEIICINDCSQDNSFEILKEYSLKDKRIRLIDFKENKGAAAARNKGIEEANGEYIGFVDSDDFIDLDFYEKLYNKAIETEADCVKGQYKDSETGFVDITINKKIVEDKNNFCSTYCSCIFLSKVVKMNNIKFPTLRDMEDPVFAYTIAGIANSIVVLDNTYIHITKRQDSISNQIPIMAQVQDKILGFNYICKLWNDKKSLYPIAYWFITVFLDSLKNRNANIEEFVTHKLFNYFEKFKQYSEFLENLNDISPSVCNYFLNLKDVYLFNKEELFAKIDNANVVSFDIFDTLLLRPFLKPTHVFAYLENKYKAPNFAMDRAITEKKVRLVKQLKNKTQEDITYDDIYSKIKDEFKFLKEKELELEMQTLQCNVEMLEIFNYAKSKNKRIIITSDMYLGSDFLNKVLNKNGFVGYEKLYVSSEIGKCKGTGNIFKHIFTDLNVEPFKIVHIGDNYHSDVLSPQKLKMNAFYYKKLDERYNNMYSSNQALNFYEQIEAKTDISILLGITMLDWHNNRFVKTPFEDIAFKYGGPLLISLICQLYEIVKSRNLSDIFFVARDGYIMKKAWDLIYGKKLNVKTHYVYASRKIYSLCSKGSKDFNLKSASEYKKYAMSLILNGNKIAVVDTCAGAFSAQKLIKEYWNNQDIIGVYLASYLNYELNYINLTGQNHTQLKNNFNWDFIEFLLSSPEAPIENIENEQPIYRDILSKEDKYYQKIFPHLEKGILNYILLYRKVFDGISNIIFSKPVFEYISSYWTNMNDSDRNFLRTIKHPVDTKQKKYLTLV